MDEMGEPKQLGMATKQLRIYHLTLVLSAVLYVGYWFSPLLFNSLIQVDTQALLEANGYGALIPWPEWIWSTIFGLTIIGYVGLYFFRKAFRRLFVAVVAIGILLSPTAGVYVLTGTEAFLYDASLLLKGLVVGLSYFTSLSDHFE